MSPSDQRVKREFAYSTARRESTVRRLLKALGLAAFETGRLQGFRI